MNESKPLTEAEVRKLRDNIYGVHDDKNWNLCKKNWMRTDATQWLIRNQPKKS